ncbi:MAG: hypothetical protein ACXADO_00630 [Candidatus Thorarchaeota archaeon]
MGEDYEGRYPCQKCSEKKGPGVETALRWHKANSKVGKAHKKYSLGSTATKDKEE